MLILFFFPLYHESFTHPRPRQLKQSIAGAEGSSPVPWHLRQGVVELKGRWTYPLPPQVVQEKVLTAPAPRQWAQVLIGLLICTMPRPPQTEQVDK